MLLNILRISGHSMEPSIRNGQCLLVSNVPYLLRNPAVDDVVVFQMEGKVFVKRISEITPEGYYLTGDNKNDSLDSRTFGFIKRKQILGKVL